jgi:hypothetical protein
MAGAKRINTKEDTMVSFLTSLEFLEGEFSEVGSWVTDIGYESIHCDRVSVIGLHGVVLTPPREKAA